MKLSKSEKERLDEKYGGFISKLNKKYEDNGINKEDYVKLKKQIENLYVSEENSILQKNQFEEDFSKFEKNLEKLSKD